MKEPGSMTSSAGADTVERWIGRRGAVHLVESGLSASQAAVDRQLGANIAEIVTTVLDDCAAAEQVEILLLPMAETYAAFLHAAETGNPGESAQLPTEPAYGSTSTIRSAAERFLPDLWGIETGDLWLGSLHNLQTLTHRAVTTSQECHIPDSSRPIWQMGMWTRQADRSPLVYQLLVEPSNGVYAVTLRAMSLDKEPPRSKPEVGQQLAHSIESPLAAIKSKDISAARGHARQVWETRTVTHPDGIEYRYPTLGDPIDYQGEPSERAIQALRVLTGNVESQGLLTATTTDAHYSALTCDFRLPVTKEELRKVTYIPHYFDPFCPTNYEWEQHPQFDRTKISREPTATDSRVVIPDSESDAWRESICESRSLDIVHSWLGLSPSMETSYLDPLVRGSHLKTPPASPADSVAVIDRSAAKTDAPIETAAGIVSTVNDAITNGQELLLLAVDAKSAAWASDVLRQPVRTLKSDSVEPYTLSRPWIVNDNLIPLIDPDQSWGWRIVPTGHWLFYAAGEYRGYGGIDTVTDPEELELPCARRTDSGIDYISPTGDVEAHYETVDEIEELTPARVACLPRWPTFAGRTRIVYIDSLGVHTYRPSADWQADYTIGDHKSYFEPAAEQFIENYTIERQANSPPARHVWSILKRYYLSRTNFDVIWATRKNLKQYIDTRVRITDGGTVVLPDRSWTVPPPQQR